MSILNKFLNSRNPDSSSEMSFVDHIEDLRWHIIKSVLAILAGAIVVYCNIRWVFDHIILGPAQPWFVSYRIFCSLGHLLHIKTFCLQKINLEFQNTELSGQFMMSFSVSMMLGFIVAFPYVFWQFWKFLKPALKPSELKYARGIVFWSSFLFFLGVMFAYFLIAPFTINFFANYQLSSSFHNIITMDNYYDTMSNLVLGLGAVFELPIIVFFLSRIGVLTPAFMRAQRRYAILIIILLAAFVCPPDMFTMWLVAVPLLLLYQVAIKISERAYNERLRRKANNNTDE